MGLEEFTNEDSPKESPNKNGKWKDESWLREQYITEDRSQQSIARECGVEKGTIRYWRKKFGIYKGRECPVCSHKSEGLGNHFNQTEHGYPDIPEIMKEILVGHMMGDAWYDRSCNGYGTVGWEMKNLEFMKWLKDELDWLCSEPRVKRTPDEHARNSMFRDNYGGSDSDGYNTTYSSYTVAHPWMDKLDWMNGGEKKYPSSVPLTPMVVKIWYCGDGNLNWTKKGRPSARITASSQSELMLNMLANKFSDVICEPTVSGDCLVFNCSETEELIEWMGDVPPGMEYKFELESKEKYEEVKRNNGQ